MDSHDYGFNEDDATYNSTAAAIGSKSLLATIVVIFTAVLFVLCLHIYARYFRGRGESFRRHRLAIIGEQDPQSVGLGKSIIEAIPVFVYRTENHHEALECAVCLSEFEENEKVRLLPKCHHTFHIDCTDMWFHTHSTCPLCRASAQPDTPADSVVVLIDDMAATSGTASETGQQVLLPTVSEGNASTSMEPDSDIDLCPSCRHNEVLPSPTYPTNMLFWQRVSSMSNSDQATTSTSGKTLEKITIDIPRRVGSFPSPRQFSSDGQQEFSPCGQSLKSPGIRLRSLKKLLSADKKAVPPSPDAGRNIHLEPEGPSS